MIGANRELKRLSKVNSNKGVAFSHHGACSGYHCPMHTALATTSFIEGVSTLVVGMPECCYYGGFVTSKAKGDDLHYCYELSDDEVVFGCSEGLTEAIIEMDQAGAKIIAVIMTCVPALIGEDSQGYIMELEALIEAKVFFVDVPHFKTNGYWSGYMNAFEGLSTLGEGGGNQERINLLGHQSSKDFDRILSDLKDSGIDSIQLWMRLNLKDLIASTRSKLNIVLDVKFMSYAISQEEIYNIPYVTLWDKYFWGDIKDIYEEIYREMGLAVSDTLNNIFTEANSEAKSEKLVTKDLSGTVFSIITKEVEPLALCKYLMSFGMKPEYLHIEEYRKFMDDYKHEILQENQNPFVGYTIDYKNMNIIDSDMVLHGGYGYKPISENGIDIIKMVHIIGMERQNWVRKHILKLIS